MSNNLPEALSALMDDEADELELRRILKALESQEDSAKTELTETDDSGSSALESIELKEKWQRYHLISASCKQELHTSPSCNLLDRINASLAQEALPVAEAGQVSERTQSGKGFFQMLGQGAIAASVALAVLFTADLIMVSGNDATNGASGMPSELAGNDAPSRSSSQPVFTGDLNPATETRVAVQEALDAEEMSRLEQVVSEELGDGFNNKKVPAIFTPVEKP